MSLRDWLDAGEQMLTEKVENPLLSSVFTRLFAAETESAVDTGFAELTRLSEHYQAEAMKAEAKERAEIGLVRQETPEAMAALEEEWGPVIPRDAPDGQ